MIDVVWLIPALPLAGFLLILLFGRRLGEPKAGYLATAMVAAGFVVTVGVFFDLLVTTDARSATRSSASSSGCPSARCASTWPSSPTR